MSKPRVLFPFVEAGMGHIVPMRSVADMFEKKYGDKAEVIRTNFYTDANTEAMNKFQAMLVNEVRKHNKFHGYANFCFAVMEFFRHLALKAAMEWYIDNSFDDAMRFMRSFSPDLVFSTHWSTSYYADKLETKPINIEYCPDVRLDILWKTGASAILMPSKMGVERARSKHFFRRCKIENVPFVIRDEAFKISRDKNVNRKLLGLKENQFTVILADGGYGAGSLHNVVSSLLNNDLPINVVAVCGKNDELLTQLRALPVHNSISFYPIGYTDKMLNYIAASDLFVGKSGASSMAEPRFFGVPALITMNATKIERDNGNFYINEVGSAIKEFNPIKAANKIVEFCKNPELLKPLSDNALKNPDFNGAEVVADRLFKELKRKKLVK